MEKQTYKSTELPYGARYEPAPYKPDWFDERLKQIGGVNLYGEPNLRVVWGMDERTFRCGNPQAIKYIGLPDAEDLGLPYWIVEEWWSPERFGTFEDWEENRYAFDDGKKIDVLGEYPSRGRYWMFGGRPLFNSLGLPSALTESTLEYIESLWKSRSTNPAVQSAQNWRAINDRVLEEQKRKKELAQKQADIAWDECVTNFDKNNQIREYSFAKKGALYIPNTIKDN